MARPRSFDIEAFLDEAMAVFWARGFGATAMADIYSATGIGPGSVYTVVKDKEALFQRVFERYAVGFRATMASDLSGLAALQRWFAMQVEFLTADPDRKGCLIANTIMERHAFSPETQQLAAARIDEIRDYFRTQIAAGQAEGSVRADLESGGAADALLGAVTGMMALARGRADDAVIANIATAALAALAPPISPSRN
jgi:TetR/AcrR family transcriptional repressor of nem operon